MQDLRKLETDLWEAADQLRANSRLTAGEYSMPVLGLIFLRQATNRFYQVREQLEATLPSRGGEKRPLTAADFRSKTALYLPEVARYDYLANLPGDANIGQALVTAMSAIERESAMLSGALPKEYTRFDPTLLRTLLRIFDRDALRKASGDVFGRIYEYFLNKFAMTGAQEGGEFFTPPALVRLIVNVIEPQQGTVFDCAVGSGGMFVQTGYFLEQRGEDPSRAVVFFGQEKNDLTIRLARMNLAVHGLEGTIHEGNTFYDVRPELVGACDFVMANPPFNVDMVDPERIKGDPRLPFGVPGTSQKSGAVSNGNYLWIQYFYAYLNERGRAGFVMASSATDAGHGEKRIRQELVRTGHVDAIVAIGTNFFYTRSLPCTLWFLDKAKPPARQDTVLMIDARSIYRVVTRKIRDFSDEQLQNLTAITWLYRGEQARFLALVGGYLERAYGLAGDVAEQTAGVEEMLAEIGVRLKAFAARRAEETAAGAAEDAEALGEALVESKRQIDHQQETGAALRQARDEARAAWDAAAEWRRGQGPPAEADNATLHAGHDRFAPLAEALRGVQKKVQEASKATEQALAQAESGLGARRHSAWDNGAVRRLLDELERRREEVVETIRGSLYFSAQANWLQSRFPDATFVAVPGLCAAVTREEIEVHDGSLMPGRYVGVAPAESLEDEEFEGTLRAIHAELAELDHEAGKLAGKIKNALEGLL